MDKFAFHLETRFMPVRKKRSNFYIFLAILFLSSSVFFSCANEDCISVFNNHVLLGFVKVDTLESGEIKYSELDTIFYSVKALDNDSVFYEADTTMSIVTLPVNPSSDLTSFELVMLDSISYDSLNNPTYFLNPNPHRVSVSYRRSQRIISENCGVEIAYTNLNVEEITFKDTALIDNKLSRLNEVNLEVYF